MAQTVRDVMTTNLVTCPPSAPLKDAAGYMRDRDIGDVLVVDDGSICGIVTDRDIVVRCVAEGGDPRSAKVGDVCSADLTTISSDAPIEELDPWGGLSAGVLHHWRSDQRVTVEEALVAATVAPAWQTYDEHRRGRLLPGYFADLVVLDRDPLAIPPDELPEVQVVATMVGGSWTHNPPPW